VAKVKDLHRPTFDAKETPAEENPIDVGFTAVEEFAALPRESVRSPEQTGNDPEM
jgi:hypothetical protein